LVRVITEKEFVICPKDAGVWSVRFGVGSSQIRADIKYLRKHGYLPSARLATLKKKFKPLYEKDGLIL
jgi:hypothetical protein